MHLRPTHRLTLVSLGLAASLVLVTGCTTEKSTTEPTTGPAGADGERVVAVATIEPKSGSSVEGRAQLTEDSAGKVGFLLEVWNAPPGPHAVHFHENGDCSSADGKSAGGHWNPTAEPHGHPDSPPHHLGDLGNMMVGADGRGELRITDCDFNLKEGDPHSALGKSIIIHADADDFVSQPSGNAGPRIACGVVTPKTD